MTPQSKTAESLPCPSLTPSSSNVCVVVVAFFPDQEFEARLEAVLSQVTKVVVVDNTPCPISLSPAILAAWGARLHCISNHANIGVAAALNQGLKYALEQGYGWILTLDQDTQCYPNMMSAFGPIYEACHLELAVIGSNYFDPRSNRPKVASQQKLYVEQKTVITSGSLINAGLARKIGGFRDDYFIDQVDHEFCLRIRAHGYRVVISREPLMTHSVGRAGGADLPLVGVLPDHPPLRKYYIARNTVVTIAAYWWREPDWCLRRLVRLTLGLAYMVFLEERSLAKVRAFATGIADGLRKRLGPCKHKWLLDMH